MPLSPQTSKKARQYQATEPKAGGESPNGLHTGIVSNTNLSKPDLHDKAAVTLLVNNFYDRLLKDPLLAPLFLETAEINIQQHLPRIIDYWCKMLFQDTGYKRHTMAIHRQVHRQSNFTQQHFDTWLHYFEQSVDDTFSGPYAEQAKNTAGKVINNMKNQFLYSAPAARGIV